MNYRWAIWGVVVVVWTLLLVTPQPIQLGAHLIPEGASFPVSKSLHVAGYAILTILSGWVPMRSSLRWLLLLLVSCHGFMTEFAQTFVPPRTGSMRDVGFDHIGILLGLVLSWRWWRQRDRASPT